MRKHRDQKYALNGLMILILALSLTLAFIGGLMYAPSLVEIAWATEPPGASYVDSLRS